RKRKGKAVATSSNQASQRFKTLYHEAHFNSMLSARRILPELILQADEDVFNPIRYQIYNRKWEKFTKPIQAVGHLMVKEFYANAWEPDKAKRKHPTYTSSVRGTEVSFAPSHIKRVLKLKSDPYLIRLLFNILNNHPNSNNNKTSLQVSILTLTPPCPKFKGGLTNNTKKIGEDLRPLTQEWIEWMIN
ncbi:hypothetical protein PIB30_104446, partial [Stylosanthes scabra]|nr:hypothetical protein [Stylosanthes scabra]